MLKDFEEDIHREELERIYLSFFSDKLRVGIIGGGKAAAIKIRTLLKKNIYVEALAKEFSEEILSVSDEKLILIRSDYNEEFIKDKHLIIIAINDNKLLGEIKNQCERNYKLYINCSDFRDGMGVMPVQRSLNNISFGLSTNSGNPKGALLASNLAIESLKDIDSFLGFIGILRNNAKKLTYHKSYIIEFINSDDFKFFWDKGKDKIVLNLFFDKDDVEYLYRYRGDVNGDSDCN